MSSTAGVAGPGPSSKVNATVRAVASSPVTAGAVWMTTAAGGGHLCVCCCLVGACLATPIVVAAGVGVPADIARRPSWTAEMTAWTVTRRKERPASAPAQLTRSQRTRSRAGRTAAGFTVCGLRSVCRVAAIASSSIVDGPRSRVAVRMSRQYLSCTPRSTSDVRRQLI